jgi:hypothetical protein
MNLFAFGFGLNCCIEREQVKQIMGALMEGAIRRCAAFGIRLPEVEVDLEKVGGKVNYKTGSVEPLKS